jgi:hypothetical protein
MMSGHDERTGSTDVVCRYAAKAVRQEAESFGDRHDPGVAGVVIGSRYRANHVRYPVCRVRLRRASAEGDLSSAVDTLFEQTCNYRCREIEIGLGYLNGELTVR